MDKPYIHLFTDRNKKYVYDVNTKVVLNISDGIYEYLLNDTKDILSEDDKTAFDDLKARGFFSSNRIVKTEHQDTELLPFYYDGKLNYLILQLTQNCNLRCGYCVYSGGYNTRSHSHKRMSFDMAKMGLDYLIDHSRYSDTLALGFYGGEPLLEFGLLQKCVEYLETNVEGKQIWYSITTNGTLLTEKIVDYLVEKNFGLTLSIDGPKEKHDEHRKRAGSNQGSFDIIMKNITYIRNKYPKYFETKVMVNTVLDTGRKFKEISDFFANSVELRNVNSVRASIISSDYAKSEHSEHTVCEEYLEEARYEEFKLLLSALNRLDDKYVSPLLKQTLSEYSLLKLGTIESHRESLGTIGHHGGPCVPGANRIFMNVDGELYPCEKVCELSKLAKLGDICSGIDLQQARNMLNIELVTQEKCRGCWAYDFCDVCIRLADDKSGSLKRQIECHCEETKINLEEKLKNYCFLQEFGFNFETMEYEGGNIL